MTMQIEEVAYSMITAQWDSDISKFIIYYKLPTVCGILYDPGPGLPSALALYLPPLAKLYLGVPYL